MSDLDLILTLFRDICNSVTDITDICSYFVDNCSRITDVVTVRLGSQFKIIEHRLEAWLRSGSGCQAGIGFRLVLAFVETFQCFGLG